MTTADMHTETNILSRSLCLAQQATLLTGLGPAAIKVQILMDSAFSQITVDKVLGSEIDCCLLYHQVIICYYSMHGRCLDEQ